MNHARLILASGSPRRKTLLEAAGLEFEIRESGVDEVRREGEPAREFALRMAAEKALIVSAQIRGAFVLAADTVVECAGKILGKPTGPGDARGMLELLSGNTHTVITAFALARDGAVLDNTAVASSVTFRAIPSAEIDDYLAGGEPFDKAGAYGIQGAGADFIVQVDGPRDNVMGLPVREVLASLRRHGLTPRDARI